MSMIMQYVRIRDDELAHLRDLLARKPDQAYDYVDELADADADDVAPEHSRGMDTDKTWAGLHYLLTQAGAPVDPVHGGRPLTNDEWGYEPPRLIPPAEVAETTAYLHAMPFERLAEHFDPVQMAGIYPDIWTEGASALEYLRSWYGPLTEFFAQAAAAREGIVAYLT